MRAKLIACKTVNEGIRELIPADMPCTLLEFGLHLHPDRLHAALQAAIDETTEDVDTILLGFGFCSRGAAGLEARRFRLVMPAADDCIALFLGSGSEYARQCLATPGTFYLTHGWIECGDDPYTDYQKMVARYGAEKAYRLEKLVIKNYTRLALINTGGPRLAEHRAYANEVAQFFNLRFEEIPGSLDWLTKLIRGEWDEGFLVVEPGGRLVR